MQYAKSFQLFTTPRVHLHHSFCIKNFLCRKYLFSLRIIGLPQTLLYLFCSNWEWDWDPVWATQCDVHFRSEKEEERKVLFFFHWHSTTTMVYKVMSKRNSFRKMSKKDQERMRSKCEKKVFFRFLFYERVVMEVHEEVASLKFNEKLTLKQVK